jgi:6-pyruvoyltetrahydropterin/6-carboxytetrahydropterin synthase
VNSSAASHTTRIAREFHWEMGHRLPFHASGCANVHGHSYKMWVELEGTCDENGMLMDYGDLKTLVAPIIAPLDHAFMVNDSDDLMLAFFDQCGLKSYRVPFNSTAENIARHLLDLIAEHLTAFPAIHVLRIRLQETDTSWAETERILG